MPQKFSIRISLIALFGFALAASQAAATVLPESYPLRSAAGPLTRMDPGLEAWIRAHSVPVSVATLPKAEFDRRLTAQDRFVAEYLRLARAAATARPPGAPAGARQPALSAEQTAKAFAFLEANADRANAAKMNRMPDESGNSDADREGRSGSGNLHPMYPWFAALLIREGRFEGDGRQQLETRLREVAPQSCARQRRILDQLVPDNIRTLPDEQIMALITDVRGFRSTRFRRLALEALGEALTPVPAERRTAIAPAFGAAIADVPALVGRFAWLPESDHNADDEAGTQSKAFAEVRKSARKGRCDAARAALVSAIESNSATGVLTDAITAGTAVERCFRGKGGVTRAATFWREVEPAFGSEFGFPGTAGAMGRLAVLEWTADRHDSAREILQNMLERSRAEKFRDGEARAIYTMARIAEDLDERARAIELYTDYATRFPDLENFEAAFMSLVTIRMIDRQWSDALPVLQKELTRQGELALDARSTGLMSFALFWMGRAHLELGQKGLSQEMWSRLAREYYSTFYGALGHYLLEKSTKQQLTLEPSRGAPFRPQSLRAAFAGRDRETFDRVTTLLQIGQQNDAVCEASELDASDNQSEKILAKSLVMHVAGDWLDAIRLYDSLPRSFRNTLAPGFERILFPRAWEREIMDFSRRLGVDSDLVFALIRQESVYNPRAQSLAGALGLMQLMPATARLEAKRLSKGYLTTAEHKAVKRHGGISTRAILDPETNLKLGIHHISRLLAKYKSPIFVLAAYNAGPSPTERWSREIPTDDLLAFIERIPYAETRSYVKLILRNYFYYKRWYETPNPKLKHLDVVTSPLLAVADRLRIDQPSAGPVVLIPDEKPSASGGLPAEIQPSAVTPGS